jgi:hypothetical protein
MLKFYRKNIPSPNHSEPGGETVFQVSPFFHALCQPDSTAVLKLPRMETQLTGLEIPSDISYLVGTTWSANCRVD